MSAMTFWDYEVPGGRSQPVMITIGKMLVAMLPDYSDPIWLSRLALSSVLVGLLAVWAMLVSGSLLFSCLAVLVVVAAAAWLLDRSDWGPMFSIKLLEAAWLLGTLWIVRRCGYRLVRRTPEPDSPVA